MFDAPIAERTRIEWRVDLPIEDTDWNVGLIVGPSGSGKSTILRSAFGEPPALAWDGASVVDGFGAQYTPEQCADALSAVGFNTIPAWLRPYSVLSTGEQFRADLARRLLEVEGTIAVDEFTSTVDRVVARSASHAAQKYVRAHGRQMVVATCHDDVTDWLQPDWVIDAATRTFTRRLLQRRPGLDCVVARVPYAAWSRFAPFHYLTATLNRSARCFGLWCEGSLAAFAGVVHFPHARVHDIKRITRVVTLPDYQGLGLALALIDRLGAAYKAIGFRLRGHPAHPSLARSLTRSKAWINKKKLGVMSKPPGAKSTIGATPGGRPCASFEYCGPAMDEPVARDLLGAT